MGRRYNLTAENFTTGTGVGLAAFQTTASPNAGSVVEVERVEVTQNSSTTTAQLRLAFSTRDTAGTYTMTSTTPKPLVAGGPASAFSGNTAPAGGTGRSGTNSSADSGGTYTDLYYYEFNNQVGFLWQPVPEQKIIIPPSTLFVVRMLAAPGTTTGWCVSVILHEVI